MTNLFENLEALLQTPSYFHWVTVIMPKTEFDCSICKEEIYVDKNAGPEECALFPNKIVKVRGQKNSIDYRE